MTDDNYKTLRVPKDSLETAKEQKESAGRTWGEQIVRPDGQSEPTQEDLREFLDRMDAILSRLKE